MWFGPQHVERRCEADQLPTLAQWEDLKEQLAMAKHMLGVPGFEPRTAEASPALAEAARELLEWNWEEPEHLDWTEVRVDIANLRRALDVPRRESAPIQGTQDDERSQDTPGSPGACASGRTATPGVDLPASSQDSPRAEALESPGAISTRKASLAAPELLEALRQATISLESAAAWRRNHPADDIWPWLASRAGVARAALDKAGQMPGADVETAFVAGFDRGHVNACMGVPFATSRATQAFRDWRLAHPAALSSSSAVNEFGEHKRTDDRLRLLSKRLDRLENQIENHLDDEDRHMPGTIEAEPVLVRLCGDCASNSLLDLADTGEVSVAKCANCGTPGTATPSGGTVVYRVEAGQKGGSAQ